MEYSVSGTSQEVARELSTSLTHSQVADGIELNRVNENVGFYNPCWAHANTDGISIYASIDEEDGVDSNETYTIYVGNYLRDFSCETYVSKIKNGAAIIMDGPKTEGAESKWQQGE